MSFLNNKEIGNRLKSKREELKLKSRQFAIGAGVDPSQYAKIEKGELPITTKIMDKLAIQYQLDSNSILYGTNVPREKRGHLPEVAPVSDATSLSILIASNKALSDAALIQAEKDKINAEANKIREQKELNLVKNNTELTQAIRESTSRGSHDHPLSDPTVISNLLETLVALGMGSLWKTREEGLVSLGNKLALPENVIEMMVSTHADGGR